MPLQIIRNDITLVKADAIVNTANPFPIIGGGTDWAIHQAAGPELLEARRKIGIIYDGESVATPAFQLPAKFVLHTVSPAWTDGSHQEEMLLREAYDSALALADKLGCKSVAFPLMAAGTYGFPHDLALSVALGAFTDFLLEHEMQIYLVLFNATAFNMASSLFDNLKSFINDNYVSDRIEEEYMIDGAVPSNVSDEFQMRTERRHRQRMNHRYEGCASVEANMPQQDTLDAPISYAASLEDVLKQHEPTFSEYLMDLLRERDGKDSEVYKRAAVSKSLFSKILSNKDYQPTKTTAIQLALGLQLTLPQTQQLLAKAGYALTRSSKADLVIQYYIERKIYNITYINTALDDCGLPLLKIGLKA